MEFYVQSLLLILHLWNLDGNLENLNAHALTWWKAKIDSMIDINIINLFYKYNIPFIIVCYDNLVSKDPDGNAQYYRLFSQSGKIKISENLSD